VNFLPPLGWGAYVWLAGRGVLPMFAASALFLRWRSELAKISDLIACPNP